MKSPRRRFRIPKIRKANGHKVTRMVKSGPMALDMWGCSMEPGKYFGRFLHREEFFYAYGSWYGDCVALHREDERDSHPVARVYFTPAKAWWTQPLVFGTEANGLIGLHDAFVAFTKTHPLLKNPS